MRSSKWFSANIIAVYVFFFAFFGATEDATLRAVPCKEQENDSIGEKEEGKCNQFRFPVGKPHILLCRVGI